MRDVLHHLLQLRLADRRPHLRSPGSRPSPTAAPAPARRSARRSGGRRPSWTTTRLAAVQRCPVVPKPPHRQPSTARSRLASSITMMTFLPPISRWTFLNVGAHGLVDQPAGRGRSGERDDARRPDEPTSGAPAPAPSPVTRLTTPGGRPASTSVCTKLTAESGASSAGLKHDGVAADQRRQDLPGGHRDREVPGGDHAADADRLAHRHRELVAQLRRRRLAVAGGGPRRPSAAPCRSLPARRRRSRRRTLPISRVMSRANAVLALGEELRRAERISARRGAGTSRQVGIGLRRRRPRPGRTSAVLDFGEEADQVVGVGGAAVLERLARGRRHPLAIDEVGVSLYAHGSRRHA